METTDPAHWGHSLVNLAEPLLGCLDAAGARSVAEVGAYAGDLTRLLLDWAAGAGARVTAIEPAPHPALSDLAVRHPELELVRETSREALAHLPLPDAVLIDSDHNYYTVSEELRLIDERASEAGLPLLIFHDVGWPNGRRDSYWRLERVPEEHRQPTARLPALLPGNPGLAEDGLVTLTSAAHEGGPRNGVLTAIEDFLEGRDDLRMTTVSAFFGLGVVWRADAPWAPKLAEFLRPWGGNPLLERLEANRVLHLATSHGRLVRLERAETALQEQLEDKAQLERSLAESKAELDRLRARTQHQERVLRGLLDSGGLRVADRISALRHPRRDWSWPDRIGRALSGGPGGSDTR